jgi:hypothetical protein
MEYWWLSITLFSRKLSSEVWNQLAREITPSYPRNDLHPMTDKYSSMECAA